MEINYLYLLDAMQLLLLIYLGSTSLYLFIFAIASLFPYKRKKPHDFKKRRFALLIPCYREDEVIIEVSKSALSQNYPKSHFDVIVIADKFEQKTIKKLKDLPIILYNEDFPVSTKTRALNHALINLPDNKYDVVCILDADNLMEPDFLGKVNDSFSNGYIAVQGHRVAKNMNTNFAILDAISEEVNNNLFRKGHRVLGLSSALIGSAMAFDYKFFKNLMQDVEVVGGFDKEIELRLLRDGYLIEYLPFAYVYDEKVQNAAVFSRQRRRWLSAQFHYFGIHFVPALKALFTKGNIDYFNKALQYLQLPRVLLAGILAILTATSWLFNGQSHFTMAWSISLFLALVTILLSVPAKFYTFTTIKAMAALPIGFLYMLLSLLRIKGANKQFIHTKHTFNAFQIKRKKTN
jgi:cellulose synthase/poly-beta-1,6-N-acetylglucosamine synthase-like glycosyltransferase